MNIASEASQACLRKLCSRTIGPRYTRSASNFPKHVGSGRYEVGDRVLISYKDGRHVRSKLLPPLKVDGTGHVGGSNTYFKHKDIIGQPSKRIYVETYGSNSLNRLVRVTQPSFEDFVALSPRTVTPIYASYSAFMANLLDIHVDPPSHHNDPKTPGGPGLQILEAGTGHGSLTIHLARAIAAANPPPPDLSGVGEEEGALQDAWQKWKDSRRAVLHTVELQASRSKDAEKTIRSFRGGLYWPHIDFYSGKVDKWLKGEVEKRQALNVMGNPSEFLDIVCLDLHNVQQQLEQVQHAMKNHGQLLVYVPQITQLAICQQEIERLDLPLKLHQVTELGEGISNGREWDLRFLKPRAEQKAEQLPNTEMTDFTTTEDLTSSSEVEEFQVHATEGVEGDAAPTATSKLAFPTMVCRPKVGKLTIGGAFIGLWRKLIGS